MEVITTDTARDYALQERKRLIGSQVQITDRISTQDTTFANESYTLGRRWIAATVAPPTLIRETNGFLPLVSTPLLSIYEYWLQHGFKLSSLTPLNLLFINKM